MNSASAVAGPVQRSEDGTGLAATIKLAGQPHNVFLRASAGPLTSLADRFLALALLRAIRLGTPLRIAGDVSPMLLAQLGVLQDVYRTWYQELQQIAVEATAAPAVSLAAGRGRGCFFTGDVASFYTFFKHRSAITHVIVARGLDVPRQGEIADTVQRAAAELGKPVLLIESNGRELLDAHAGWQTLGQGAARAGVAHALAPQLSHVYVPGAIPYYRLIPYGSQPLTDRLWRSDAMRIVHDGAEATPWEKADQALREPLVRRYLRVCRQSGPAYNCGQCADCLSMMAYLRAEGLEGSVATLPPLPDLDHIRGMSLATPAERACLDEMRFLLANRGGPADVIAALDDCLDRYLAPEHEVHWTVRTRAAQAALMAAQAELRDAQTSLSWRITGPLRALAEFPRSRRRSRA